MRRLTLIILVIIGVSFLIPTAVMLGIFHQQTRGMVPVEGTIASWDGDHPVVAYTVDGQEYFYHSNVSYSPHRPVGSSFRLLATPGAPIRAADYFLAIMGGIFGAVALVLLITGFAIWFVLGRREKRREELLQYGLRTTAVILELEQNRSVSVNNRHPWVVVATCAHPSTHEQMTVRSHMVWHPTVAEGDKVDVAFDPMDERRYAVDVPEEKR